MILDTVVEKKKGTHTRYLILLIIFIVTAVNYADRATLSIAGTEVAKELQLSAISMGYIFSAFGWAYLLMQILAAGCWISSVRRKSTLTVCSSGRCLLFCRVLSTCSRWLGRVFQCSSCALCWASRKRRPSRRTPVLWRPGSRRKSAVRHLRFLTPHNISLWRCFRRCWAG